MDKLKPAYEAKGYTGRKLGEKTGIHPSDISRFVKGRANPVPKDFQKICAELDCAPEAIATPREFDYGVAQGDSPSKARKPDIRENSDRADVRGPADGIAEFKTFCREHGLTMWGFIRLAMPLVAEVMKGQRAA